MGNEYTDLVDNVARGLFRDKVTGVIQRVDPFVGDVQIVGEPATRQPTQRRRAAQVGRGHGRLRQAEVR